MFLLLFHTTLCTNTVCIWVENRRGKIIGHRRITQIIRNLQIRIRKECIHHQNATDTSVCFEYTKKTQEKPLLARKQRKHPLVSMYSRWFLSTIPSSDHIHTRGNQIGRNTKETSCTPGNHHLDVSRQAILTDSGLHPDLILSQADLSPSYTRSRTCLIDYCSCIIVVNTAQQQLNSVLFQSSMQD